MCLLFTLYKRSSFFSSALACFSALALVAATLFPADLYAKDAVKEMESVLSDYAKFKEKNPGQDCKSVDEYNRSFESKIPECSKIRGQLQGVQAEIGSLCNKYSGSKKDYNSCTAGGSVSTDNLDPAAADVRKIDVKIQKEIESRKQGELSECEAKLNSYVNNAKAELKKCEANIKASSKTDKKADKAQDKADKAQNKANEAKSEYDAANNAYEACMVNAYGTNYKADGKDSDPNNKCSKEYKKLSKAAEAYQKKQDKADDKKEDAKEAQKKADAAEQKKLNGNCTSPDVWNKNINGCAPSSTWSKAQYEMYDERYKSCISKLKQSEIDPLTGQATYKASELNKCKNDKAKVVDDVEKLTNYCAQEENGKECDFIQDYLEKNLDASLYDATQAYKAEASKPVLLGDKATPEECSAAGGEWVENTDASHPAKGCYKAAGNPLNADPGKLGAGGNGDGETIEPTDGKCPDGYTLKDNKCYPPSDKVDKSEATGSGKYQCPALSGATIFDYLACRITNLVRDLRAIVYVIAMFGMVGFAYSAIIGKINWKQLANIAIGLFILSMTTSIIEYVALGNTDGKGAHLKYGNYLPNGNHAAYSKATNGGYSQKMEQGFDQQSYDLSGLDALKNDAASSKWSLKDLKSSIKSAKDAINTAANAYSAAKNTVKTTVQAAKNISNAIKNGGNIIDVVTEVANNVSDVTKSAAYTTSVMMSAASTISNDIKDAQSSSEQRQYKDALRSEYDKLAKKCKKSATACNKSELDALARLEKEMDENTTGVDKWVDSTGKDIKNAVNNVNNIAGKAKTAGNAAKQGQGKGKNTANKLGLGGGLADILSFGYGVTDGVNAGKEGYKDLKEGGSLDFRSSSTKEAEAAEKKDKEGEAACSKAGGTYANGQCRCPEGQDMRNNKCVKIKGAKTEEPKKEEAKKEEPKAEEPKAEEPKKEEPKAEEPKKTQTKAKNTKEKTCSDGSKPSKSGACCGSLGLGSDGYCNCPKGQNKSKGHCCPANTSWNDIQGKCENSEYSVCILTGAAFGKKWNDKTKKCECPENKVLQGEMCKSCPSGARVKDGKCVCDFGYHRDEQTKKCVYNCKGDEVWNQSTKTCACPKEGQVYKHKEGKCVCKNGIANNGKCK